MTEAPQPFEIAVPDETLADLRERLARTRWPSQPPAFLIKVSAEDGNYGIGEATSQTWYLGETAPQIEACIALYDQALRGHEIECCNGNIEALQYVRHRMVDVVLTSPSTTIAEDLALVRELASTRPGIRTIVFSRTATREELIAAMRSRSTSTRSSTWSARRSARPTGATASK